MECDAERRRVLIVLQKEKGHGDRSIVILTKCLRNHFHLSRYFAPNRKAISNDLGHG